MRTRQKPDWQQKIAEERIGILFYLSKKELEKNPARSRRYIELARKIAMRYNVRLPKETKLSFCKKCNTILVPGKTSQVRLESKTGSRVIKCKNCNNVYRLKYK